MSAGGATSVASLEATTMFREAAEAAEVVRCALATNASAVADLAARLNADPPRFVVTCARGSSDHAATYAKYLLETRARIVCASAAPSVSSLYGVTPDLRQALFVAISQSGRSPDLLAVTADARRAGALVVALCNDPTAPLGEVADVVLPIAAGPERGVAATKSFIATLAVLAQIVAAWTTDAALAAELARLPERISDAWGRDWSAAVPLLSRAQHLYVIGRGLSLGLALETALKFKETCQLHAEAYSSAEVRHGPIALLGDAFPALIFVQDDAARAGLESLARELVRRGVPVAITGATVPGAISLATPTVSPVLAPITMAASMYRLVAATAIARGVDPDRPPHLAKITETI